MAILAHIREQAGLLPQHTEVRFEFDGTSVRILRAEDQSGHGGD